MAIIHLTMPGFTILDRLIGWQRPHSWNFVLLLHWVESGNISIYLFLAMLQ